VGWDGGVEVVGAVSARIITKAEKTKRWTYLSYPSTIAQPHNYQLKKIPPSGRVARSAGRGPNATKYRPPSHLSHPPPLTTV